MLFGSIVNRLATSAKRALSQYAVGANEPELALNFIDNEYITNNSTSTFASAVTHAMSSNSVMTDGYGSELVVNSSFTTDVSSWSIQGAGVTASSLNGVATVITNSFGQGIYQNITTEAGKTYIINWDLLDTSLSSANVTVRVYPSGDFSGSFESTEADNGYLSFIATGTDSRIYLRTNGADVTKWDNVSVREMPVLKWSPHNLLTYSEQFDNAAWPKTDTTITANAAIAPDGTQTADEITHTSAAPAFSRAVSPVEDGVNYTHSVFVKYIDHQWIRIGHDSASSPFGTWFDVQNGVIGTKGSNHVSSSIEDVGNGWYKLTVEGTADGTSFSTYILLADSDGGTGKVAGTSAYIWGAHLYRSDLGGMVDNPDRGDSYVPTTSSAKYLPRIGHHVYNGSAWANEGLLAESEARTNILPNSGEFSTWAQNNATTTDNAKISPDGMTSASTITTNTVNGEHFVQYNLSPATGTFTDSVYVKANGYTQVFMRPVHVGATEGNTQNIKFDIEAGTVLDTPSNTTGTIQDVGNGWYRIAATFTISGTITGVYGIRVQILDNSGASSFTGDGTSGIHIYGAQREEASTPSSFIPTDTGSSVTRAAEDFTIPSANLPWPSPNYIGSELVTNGDFSNGETGFTEGGDGSGSVSNEEYTIVRGSIADQTLSQAVTTVVGKVYEFSVDVSVNTGGKFKVVASGSGTLADSGYLDLGTTGKISLPFVANTTSTTVRFQQGGGSGSTSTFDNFSVREIDPLSVSIAMDGRMTYTDSNNFNQVKMVQWQADTSNLIRLRIDTNSTATGRVQVTTKALGTERSAGTSLTYFDPDILVPYDMAGVITTTGSRGAEGGVALTDSGAMTAIADLSSTDLSLADEYMGTIGTFRVWDRDITDTGLVEATNPSLEPSLSLTFEGTGTNSFVVNDWSE